MLSTHGAGLVGSLALLTLCLIHAGAAVAAPSVLYVSPAGNDAWSGRLPEPNRRGTDGPFATIEQARATIRAHQSERDLPRDGFEVVLRAGAYGPLVLTRGDSGAPGRPVVYRAAAGEAVRLSGGRTLAPEALRPVTDEAVLARLAPEARPHVRWVDLAAEGVGPLWPFPVSYRGAPAVPELFWDGQRLTLAHWPNEGWATIASIVEPGARPRDGDASGRVATFEYTGDRPSAWDVAAGVWLQGYWCYDWYEETIRVRSIDAEARRITLDAPHLYSVMAGNPSPRRFRAWNALEELDAPGEYYLDTRGGRLLVWPPAEPAGGRVSLSLVTEPVVRLQGASHVTLRGLTIEEGLGDGVVVRGGTDCRIEACDVRNLRQMGIRVEGGTAHRVEACEIHETGTGGLLLEGGDRKTLTPAGHEALNNHIHGFSRHQFTSAYGLVLSGVGNRAAHNLVHDAPHQAVSLQGNDHVFERNEVHHVCTATDDCGALYKGRNPSCRGNLVRHNLWYAIGSRMGHGSAAVYFDDGDGGDTVFGNVFFRCGGPGRGSFGTVFSHGGHGNTAANNLFIECRRALGSAPWDDARWRRAIDGGEDCFWIEKLRHEVDIASPPYTTRYPELVGFLDPQPGRPRVNVARDNVLVECGEISSGNWQCDPAAMLVVDHDPGFVDAARGDFGLRADCEVYAALPGFEPIPFDRIGLCVSHLRPRVAPRLWPPE